MKGLVLSAGLLAVALVANQSAIARDRTDHDDGKLTIAVFGDWPYSQNLLDKAKLLTDSVNADRDVDYVIHVGDIHSGSMPCTSAGILPPIPASNPGWNQAVYYQFQQFKAPVVYAPGDNEWSDCHKTKELKSGDPLKELASVRTLFFAKPGKTLGMTEKDVWSQAKYFDPAYPADAQFVENVMWEDAKVVFATFNMPGGSNNDTSPWTNGFENPTAQAAEVSARAAANIRWLQTAFEHAEHSNAKAVVLALQADMWDPEAAAIGGAGLDQYKPFVRELATRSLHFRRPVLLLNGDTHLFLVDRPLANPGSTTGQIHNTPPVPNLLRIVVQGSTNPPAEWLRLTIDPRNYATFGWQNVPYCAHPDTAC
jgi:Calcineurin-like phosphoesterase